MRKLLCLAALTLYAVAACAGAASAVPSEPTGVVFKTIAVAGQDYKYAVYVPRDYTKATAWPTILFLHGAGECGTDGQKPVGVGIMTAVFRNPEKWPFIVVIAQKPEVSKQWEEYDDALMAMLSKTKKEYNVDSHRVYLTGLSQGGHGTWFEGAKHADIWAAIAPVCAYGDPSKVAEQLKSMPIWIFHGEADHLVAVQQAHNFVDAITAAGGAPKLTTYPGVDHNSWDRAYGTEDLGAWFLQHQR